MGLAQRCGEKTALLPPRETYSFQNAAAHRRLVRGNWIRTIAWTLRGFLVLAYLPRLVVAIG